MKPEVRAALARAAYESDLRHLKAVQSTDWEEINEATRERYEKLVEAVMGELEKVVITHLWGQL